MESLFLFTDFVALLNRRSEDAELVQLLDSIGVQRRPMKPTFWVFEEVEGEGDADSTPRISSPGVIFHAATGIDATPVAPVQTTLQKRILRAFVARGLLATSAVPRLMSCTSHRWS